MLTDRQFLLWLRDRLEYIYHESPNVDFVTKLEDIAMAIPEEQRAPKVFLGLLDRLREQSKAVD